MSGQSLQFKLPIANVSPNISTEKLVNSGTSINTAKPDKVDFKDSLKQAENHQKKRDQPERDVHNKEPVEKQPQANKPKPQQSADKEPRSDNKLSNKEHSKKTSAPASAENTQAKNKLDKPVDQEPQTSVDNESHITPVEESIASAEVGVALKGDKLLLVEAEASLSTSEDALPVDLSDTPLVTIASKEASDSVDDTLLSDGTETIAVLPQNIIAAATPELTKEALGEVSLNESVDTPEQLTEESTPIVANLQTPEKVVTETIVNPQLAAYKGQLPPKVQAIANDIVKDKNISAKATISVSTNTPIIADDTSLNKVDLTTIKFDGLADKTVVSAQTPGANVNSVNAPQLPLVESSNNLLTLSETAENAKVFADKLLQFGGNQYQGGGSSFVAATSVLSVDSLVNSPFSAPGASTPTSSALPQINVGLPFQQAQWGQNVADKVLWMSSQGLKEAEIQMDPPELGPLTVKVSISQDQAHVSFAVQHASVREALDQGALRLREMFAEEGLDLVDVDVSGQQQSEEQQSNEEGTSQQGPANEQADIATASTRETALDIQGDSSSLINTYI